MKKTLAILISAILVVAAVFAFVLTSGADVTAATSVEAYIDGSATATVLDATTTTATHAGTGTFTFDAATGTLTLNNLVGNVRFVNAGGKLIVKLVGTNKIDTGTAGYAFNVQGADKVTVFTSDSATNSLEVKGGAYLVQVGGGGLLELEKNAKVTLNAADKDPLHFGNGSLGLTMKDNAVLTVNAVSGKDAVRCNASAVNAKLTMTGNPTLTINASNLANWGTAFTMTNYQVDGGTINVNVSGVGQAIVGLKAGGDGTTMEGNIDNNVSNFNGGTINVTISTTYDPVNNGDSVNGARCWGIFSNNVKEMNFNGTNVNVTATVDNNNAASNWKGSSTWSATGTMIGTQRTKNFNITAGTFDLKGANCDGAFGLEVNNISNVAVPTAAYITGGTFKGTALTFFHNWSANAKTFVDFEKADFSGFTATEQLICPGWTAVIPTSGDYSYEALATEVQIFGPGGNDSANRVILNGLNKTLTSANATLLGNVATDAVSFTPAKIEGGKLVLPVVALKNIPENTISRIHITGANHGSASVEVSGKNYITGIAGQSNNFNGAALFVTGKTADAALTVTGPSDAGYNLCYRRNFSAKDVAITVNGQVGDAVHGARSNYVPDGYPVNSYKNEFHLSGKTVMNVNARGQGIDMVGGSQVFTMTDDAKLTIKPIAKVNGADNTVLSNGFIMKLDREDGTGTMTLDFKMSGNAEFKVEGKGVECNRIGVERYASTPNNTTDAAELQVKAETKVLTNFELSDNAKFDVEGNGQALYFYAGGAGTVTTFVVKDNASFKALANDRPETHLEYNIGNYQSAVQFNAIKVDVDVLGGSFSAEGERIGWTHGALAFQGSTDIDIFVKDAKFDVASRNNTKSEYLKTANDTTPTKVTNNHINNAIIMPEAAKTATITFAGKAVANLSATNDTQDNRGHALWLQDGQKLIVQDEAVVNTTAGGTAKANTAAGIHSKGGDILVKDKATLNASVTGTGTAALTLEKDATLTVQGDAKVNLDGGKTGVGARNYNASSAGSITVKDNAVLIATGKTAISDAGKKVAISAKTIDAGADAKTAEIDVDAPTFKEGYIKLYAGSATQGGQQGGSTTNPGTSDVNVALFAVVALATVAVAAAVVLRKKSI